VRKSEILMEVQETQISSELRGKSLSVMTPQEIIAFPDNLLAKKIIEATKSPTSYSGIEEIERELRALTKVPGGGGGIFLGIDESLIRVIRKEAENYVVLNDTAHEGGFPDVIDYAWMINEVRALLELTRREKPVKSFLAKAMISIYEIPASNHIIERRDWNCCYDTPFPVSEFTDLILIHKDQPGRKIKLSLYTLGLIERVRFPEGIGADDYRMSVARYIYVRGIGSPQLQQTALEIDLRATSTYCLNLLKYLYENAPQSASLERNYLNWEAKRALLLKDPSLSFDWNLRRAREVNMIKRRLLFSYPSESCSSVLNEIEEKIRQILDKISRNTTGENDWPEWVKELRSPLIRYDTW